MKSTKEFLKGSNPFATGADDEEEKFVAPAVRIIVNNIRKYDLCNRK